MADISLLYGFLVSIGIGALVGIEREHEARKIAGTAGIRTFTFIALLGTTLALIADLHSHLLPLVLAGGLILLINLGYFRSTQKTKDIGLTTEVTQILVFALGYLAYHPSSREIAIILGVVAAILLELKDYTRDFVKHVDQREIRDTLKFAVITFIILPILPNTTVDPWGILNPQKIWLLVVLISGISFLGYVLVKTLGVRRGIGLTGLLGGLTSSTAVTTAMAGKSQDEGVIVEPLVFATVIAFSVMYPRVLFEVYVVNRSLLSELIPPMTAMFFVSIVSSFVIWHQKTTQTPKIKLSSPFAIKPAVKFAGFFIVILLLVHFSRTYLGSSGLYASSIVSGFVDVDAITLSVATMAGAGEIGSETAVNAIIFAALSNTVVKCVYAFALGTRRFGKLVGAVTVVIVVAGVLSILIF